MRGSTFKVALIATQLLAVTAQEVEYRHGHGLVGYGIAEYDPLCTSACAEPLRLSMLNCSDPPTDDYPYPLTSLNCYCTDDAFLTSLAYCIQTRCSYLPQATIEEWWSKDVPSTYYYDEPTPKWSYLRALDEITFEPNVTITLGDMLNDTSLISDDDFDSYYQTLESIQVTDYNHETFGIVLLVSGAGLPILFSLLRFLPLPKVLKSKFFALFIDPPLFGSRHQVPWFKLAIMPNRGQAIFIFYLIAINIILCGAGIKTVNPNVYYDPVDQVMTYLANRTGVLSFANIPLLILYSGRNSILQYVTDWSQSTFLLLHRWVAYLCILQAVLHSLLYLRICINAGDLIEESNMPYYYWGIIATLCFAVFIPAFAQLPFRNKAYEIFLVLHIIFAALAIAGCWYHIVDNYQHGWGFETWLYVAMAVWAFERAVRLVRVAWNGIKTARVEIIDDEYIKVEVDGVHCHGHAFLYFPTLTWRFWENHPFSAMPTIASTIDDSSSRSSEEVDNQKSIAKSTTQIIAADSGTSQTGVTFFVRTHGGTTRHLRNRQSVPVLIEGPYEPDPDLRKFETLVCISGGVGITAVLPLLRKNHARSRLYWSTRSAAMADAVKPILGGVDADIVVGQRHDLRKIIEEEAGVGSGAMAVLVSGPASMSDDVRMAVTEVARKVNRPIELVQKSFTW